MKTVNSVTELIGATPVLCAGRFAKKRGVSSALFAKLEGFNPAGSVKDRVALFMILEAEKQGFLKPGGVIIEPTSGNTGIGLASIGVSRGYRVILTMPETMSLERRKLLKAYGAELVLTPGKEGMKGAIAKAQELADATEGSFLPGQFDNPQNPRAHFETTGPELWEQVDGKIDVFVAGVGTGGTLTGVGGYLKQKNPSVEVVAVEPDKSPVLSGGNSGPHGLQGIGAGFVPSVLNREIYDKIITVSEEDAYEAARDFAHEEGFLVGISSGAALHAAASVAKRPGYEGKVIAVLLPDAGDRYLSTPLFEE